MLAARAGPRPEEEEEASEARTARQAARFLVRASRRMKRARKRRLDAGEPFDRTVECEFPAFRALQVREVTLANLGRQPRGDVAPELRLKLMIAVFHAVKIRPPSQLLKR